MQLDHVVLAVSDLDDGAREFERMYRLRSVAGGRHPGWGTANRIVPLGDAYLELVAVVDPAEATASAFGRFVTGASGAIGWVVRTDDIDGAAERLGVPVIPGSRKLHDGTELRWRSAGIERALAEPCLPFFIEWAADSTLPGRVFERPQGRLESISLTGDAQRLASWLGAHALPVEITPGLSAIAAVLLARDDGTTISLV